MYYRRVFPERRGNTACQRWSLFRQSSATLLHMDKEEHASRLRAAMAARGMDRKDVSAATGRGVRTVTNWATGETLPGDAERASLRKLFPSYDDPGDAVEVAILGSALTEDRQYMLIGTYKRMLREQVEGSRSAG